jgi:predicted metal-dependent peptidase
MGKYCSKSKSNNMPSNKLSAAKMIEKAKVALLLSNPFFSTIALHWEYVENRDIETAGTNGPQLFYNPAFIESLSNQNLVALLAHEVLHVALLHHTRRNKRDSTTWNEAADFAINPLLQENNFVLPEGALINPAYKGMSAESIFDLLPVPTKDDKDSVTGKEPEKKPQPGEVFDAPGETETEKKAQESKVQSMLVQASNFADLQGKPLPDSLKRLIDKIIYPLADWRQLLAAFLTELAKNDYSWTVPNRRYLAHGIYLPGLHSPQPGELIIFVDTSGSIDNDLLAQIAAEINAIKDNFKIPLKVIYIDDEVRAVQDFGEDDELELQAEGGGGTSFIPGFKYLEENNLQPAAVLYLTDGYCWRFPPPPDCPVLWALFSDVDFNPPFGEVAQIL